MIDKIVNNLIMSAIHIDFTIQHWLQLRQLPWLVKFTGIVTYFGSSMILVAISLLVFIWLGRDKRWLEAAYSYACLITAWVLMDYLKSVFARPRPEGEALTIAQGFSFPSGHAMLSMAYYGFLAMLLLDLYPGKRSRIFAAVLFILILAIGFSRIYLNVHYFSDVIFGYILGAAIIYIYWQGLKWFKRNHK